MTERFDHYDLTFSQRSVLLAHLARMEKMREDMRQQFNQLVGKILEEEFDLTLTDAEYVEFDDEVLTFTIKQKAGEPTGESSD